MSSRVKVKSSFGKIARTFPGEVARAQTKTGEDVARRAAARRGGKNFGDDTGTTRRSITWDEPNHEVVMFGDAGEYVEYGSYRPGPPNRGRMPAYKPLRTAAKTGRIAFERRIAKILRDSGSVK